MTTATLEPAAPTRLTSTQPRPLPLLRHSLTLAGRALLKIRRTPEQLLDVTLQPIIFVIMFVYLFGGAVAGSQHAYLQFVLPAIAVQTVLFSTLAIGVNLNADIDKGVFDRFRSLPIPRSAPLVGAVLGDVVRYLMAILVILGFGSAIGFRIGTDPVRTAAACALMVVFALCLCWAFVLVGLLARQASAVQAVGFLVMFPLTFGSSMFVPVATLPGWLQTWVHVNPVTHLVEAVRGLMLGGPVAGEVAWSLGWAALLLVVFAPLAVRAYRRRT